MFQCKFGTHKAWFQASEDLAHDSNILRGNIAPTVDWETTDSCSVKNLECDF